MTQAEVNIEIPQSPKSPVSAPTVPKTSNNLPDVYVGARRLLKNTPWMKPMGLGLVITAILLFPALAIWFYCIRDRSEHWTEILSETPATFEAFRWSFMSGLFAFAFSMTYTLYTLAPLGTKYTSIQNIRRIGQVIGIVRTNLAFFTASLISLFVYLNSGLNAEVNEAVAAVASAKLAASAAADTSTTGGSLFAGSLHSYFQSVFDVIMDKREHFQYIPYVLLVLSSTLLVEKIVILYISHNFHKSFYTKRIRRNNMVLSCFESLSVRFTPPNHRPIRSGAVLKNEAIILFSETIFEGLLKPGRDTLIIDDFLEVIDHPIATDLFKFLDFNQSGDISLNEFQEAIQEAYEEKRSLLKSIKANETVINRIDKFFVTVIILFKLSSLVPKMNLNFLTFVTYIGLPSLFIRTVFNHFLQQLFGSVMHFLVAHPYDVGDKIQMNHKIYRVKDMGFWKTTLISPDGMVSYVPNHTLFPVKFGNFRRSDRMESNILMSMSLNTSKERIKMYTDAINEFIKENGKYFDDHIVIKEVTIPNSDTIGIVFGIMHKFNFNNDENLHYRTGLIFQNMIRIAKQQELEYFTLRFQEE